MGKISIIGVNFLHRHIASEKALDYVGHTIVDLEDQQRVVKFFQDNSDQFQKMMGIKTKPFVEVEDKRQLTLKWCNLCGESLNKDGTCPQPACNNYDD